MTNFKIKTPETMLLRLSFKQKQMLIHVDITGNEYRLNFNEAHGIPTLRKLIKLELVHNQRLTDLGIRTRKLAIKELGIETKPFTPYKPWS